MMKIESIVEYANMVRMETNNDDLFEMANLGSHNHGIPDVVIWVGKANKQHELRIKVSNQKNRWNIDDNFTVQIPSLDFDRSQVAKWITPNIMNKIIEWIKLNQQVLVDYENDRIVYTDDFINRLSKV